jgi:sulfate/thiosulfate transport system substrate-binding protein
MPLRRTPVVLRALALGTACLGIFGAALTGWTGAPPAGAASGVSLVAYSTPKPAYAKLISLFQATSAGQGVTFTQSYGASGTQTAAVIAGLPADVVNVSLEPDMQKLVAAGIVASNWNAGPQKGMVTNSVVAFVVRPGNPKNIKTWADLVKSGVKVITPNPFSSGSAQWNILAAYGAQLKLGKTPAQAQSYVQQLLAHTVAQPASASAALQTFLSGQGDVLLAYEDDAIYAQQQGQPVSFFDPAQTILIQNPIAVTKTAGPDAKAFVSYLLSEAGQQAWSAQGYRPTLASVAAQNAKINLFPQPAALFTVDYLGGWKKVEATFFNPTTGWVARAEAQAGVSTAG